MAQFVICPRCQKNYVLPDEVDDFICNCADFNDSPVTAQEDIKVIGDWTDYTGSNADTTLNKTASQEAGLANTLWGTRASARGEKNQDRTARGRKKGTYRTRDHLEYIDLSKKKC